MITHDHKLIFVHIPKCAGRSICDIFQQRFDHYTSKYYEKEFTPYWDAYRKMTIVRNPYDRLVSLYIYIKNHRRHINEPIGLNIRSFKEWLTGNIYAYQGKFCSSSAEGQRGTDGTMGSPFWFTSQWQRIVSTSGYNELDFVFRLENHMKDVEELLSIVTGKEIKIPHLNKSEYEDYHSFYDNELFAITSQFPPVVEDCRKFDYRF